VESIRTSDPAFPIREMIKLIARDKITGAMTVGNYADFNKMALYLFLTRLPRCMRNYLDSIQFWFETDKKGTDYEFETRQSNTDRRQRQKVAG